MGPEASPCASETDFSSYPPGRLVDTSLFYHNRVVFMSKAESPRNLLKIRDPARCHRPTAVPVGHGFFLAIINGDISRALW